VQLSPADATKNFPAADLAPFAKIATDTLDLVTAGDQTGATARVNDLETAWDDAVPTLQPLDDTAWTFLDSQIDHVLTSVRASAPDPAVEKEALTALITSLAG
jgi:hypothetical protein